MKKILAILCIICMAQTCYAALDRNYFEYDLTPNGTYSGTDDDDTTVTTTSESKSTKYTRKKRKGFTGTGASQSNTYWDFGKPNYGYTGDIQ